MIRQKSRNDNAFSSGRKILFKIFHYVVLIAIAAIMLIPLIWMLGGAFRPHNEIYQSSYPLSWSTFIPQKFTIDNFTHVLFTRNFGRYFLNSVYVAVAMIVPSWYVNSLAAYALERLDFFGSRFSYGLILTTMLVPIQATLVPTYLLIKQLGMHNTLWALIVPFISEPFAVFLLVQHIKDIPKDLDDAAAIDGCGFWQTYWKVILPNLKRSLATVTLMKFIWAWNAFTWPLIAINSSSKWTLQVALATLTTRQTTNYGNTFAGAALATIPPLLLFAFAQRYFTGSTALSGMKT